MIGFVISLRDDLSSPSSFYTMFTSTLRLVNLTRIPATHHLQMSKRGVTT
jgi:hypothetical protein